MVHGFKAKAERIGEEYRAKCNVSKFSPLNAFLLSKKLNVDYYTPTDIFQSNYAEQLGILKTHDSDFHALYLKLPNEKKIIVYNDCHSMARQQSSIMHEIAHIILEHKIPDEALKLMLLYNLPYINNEHEEEARFLGGCLQLTKPSLLWARKEKWTDIQVAEKYFCSVEMVQYRKKCLGLHNKWHNNGY